MTLILNFIWILFAANTAEDVAEPTSKIVSFATADFLVGKHNYYTDSGFVEIPEHMAYRSKMFLLTEVYTNYLVMYQAAKKEGLFFCCLIHNEVIGINFCE